MTTFRFVLWTTIVYTLCRSSEGIFDLFLDVNEVQTLLGLHREIAYVRDGVVHQNALQFTLPVSSQVEKLHFTWFSELPKKIHYSLRISTSDPRAMHQPSVNISHQGYVPTRPQVWRVTLPCSGWVADDVIITLDLFLTGLSENITELEFRRKKTCLMRVNVDDHEENVSSSLSTNEINRVSVRYLFVRLLCIAGGIVLSVVLVIFSLQLRLKLQEKRRRRRQQQQQQQQQQPPPVSSQPFVLHPELMAKPQALGGGTELLSDAESRVTDWVQKQRVRLNPPPLSSEDVMASLNVDRLRLKLGQLVQEGTFGRIYQGIVSLSDLDPDRDVIIKTVVSGSSFTQSQLLISEGTSLFTAPGAGDEPPHRHVLHLLAATMDGTSPMLLYPYMAQGNLKKWLTSSGVIAQSTHRIVSAGLQILSALQYLHKRRIIHKDVATRNCFMDENSMLKLCDSALSRDLFPADYHCLGDNENRPIKWMPAEAIALKKYSRSSDVWSFGVFLWELMTRAQQPFADIDPFEMESYLHEGYRLHQPNNCPDQLYSIMSLCWSGRAAERATVHALHNNMQVFQRQLQRFV